MKIGDILKLDDGVSGLSATGQVGYLGTPKHIVGEDGTRKWDFWTVFVILKDDTGEIGANVSIPPDTKLRKGETITVIKGTLDSYTNNKNETKQSLKCRLGEQSAPQNGQQAP